MWLVMLDCRVQKGGYGAVTIAQGSHPFQLEAGEIGEDMGIEDNIS
jgi:hypothetical protein